MKAPERPRTILFLIADTGAGHRSAANAIQRALTQIVPHPPSPSLAPTSATRAAARPATARASSTRAAVAHRSTEWRTLIVDAFVECSRFPLRNGVFLYGPAIKYSPHIYGQIFRMTNSVERFNAARRICQPFLRQGLRRLLERTRPDVIVSVHPLLNHVTLQVLRDLGMHIPFVTVVTDLVTIHCAWLAPGVDACVVPTEAAKQLALASGVSPRRIRMLGMPIDPKFATRPQDTREERRTRLGLDPSLPVVLLVGGGEGAGGLAEAALALGNEQMNAQLVVITGRNQNLRDELEARRHTFRMPLHLEGFVTNMPDFLWASDVVVTKAGPGTISEAMACELPIILTGAVPGQEEGNVDFVLDNDLGVLATTPHELTSTLHALFDSANPLLERLRANVRRVGHANASLDIARLIVSYLPPAGTASRWDAYRLRTSRLRRSPVTLPVPLSVSLPVALPMPHDLLPRMAHPRPHNGAAHRRLLPVTFSEPRWSDIGRISRIGRRGNTSGRANRRSNVHMLRIGSLASVRMLLRRNRENLQLRRSGRH